VRIAEGQSGTKYANYVVRLSAASGQTVTVQYATADGPDPAATAGSDYMAVSGTLSFSPGATAKTVQVPILGDTQVELDEQFRFLLSGATNATIADGEAIGAIVNDDFHALLLAGAVRRDSSARPLTEAQLGPVVDAALASWGRSGALAAGGKPIHFEIVDLPGKLLGMASRDTVYIDVNAAGRGWYVDPTPGYFRRSGRLGRAAGRHVDLLTVVAHELGHTLGLPDVAGRGHAGDVMDGRLRPGVRRLPPARH
jgi:hypothetical protein